MTNYTQWKSLVDLHEYSAIPDSAIHHWPMDEGSETTVTDNIGNQNGTIEGNGDSWISNDWWGGFAVDCDDIDRISSPWRPSGDFMSSDFAYIFTVDNVVTEVNARVAGLGGEMLIQQGFDGPSDTFGFVLRDGSNDLVVYTDTAIGESGGGDRYRIVWNKISNDANNWQVWLNASEDDVNVSRNDSGFDPDDLSDDFGLVNHTDRGDGSHPDMDIDNIIVTDDSLSQSEIQDDYNNQPWS